MRNKINKEVAMKILKRSGFSDAYVLTESRFFLICNVPSVVQTPIGH